MNATDGPGYGTGEHWIDPERDGAAAEAADLLAAARDAAAQRAPRRSAGPLGAGAAGAGAGAARRSGGAPAGRGPATGRRADPGIDRASGPGVEDRPVGPASGAADGPWAAADPAGEGQGAPCEPWVDAVGLALALPGSVVNSVTAAQMYGLRLPERLCGYRMIHLNRGPGRSRIRRAGVISRQCTYGPLDVVRAGGVVVTSPLRTVLDLTELLDHEELVCVLDGLLEQRARPGGAGTAGRAAGGPNGVTGPGGAASRRGSGAGAGASGRGAVGGLTGTPAGRLAGGSAGGPSGGPAGGEGQGVPVGHRPVTRAELVEFRRAHRRMRGIKAFDAAMRRARPGAASALHTRLRLACEDHGIKGLHAGATIRNAYGEIVFRSDLADMADAVSVQVRHPRAGEARQRQRDQRRRRRTESMGWVEVVVGPRDLERTHRLGTADVPHAVIMIRRAIAQQRQRGE